MDIARFHRGIDAVIEAYNEAKIQLTLDNITNSLANLGANPGNTDFANQFKQSLQELKDKLEELESIKEENLVKETLDTININGVLGIDLFKTIQEKISENQISPALAAKAIARTKTAFETTIANLTAINTGFSTLKVKYEFVEPGIGEVLVNIPVERDTKALSDLATECKEWNQIFSTISEVFDPERPNLSISSISSGSWIFYLTATPLVLLGISITLRRVNQILAELIKTKQLTKQLLEINAPTEEIEKYIDQKISKDLKLIADDLVKSHYKGTDKGRKNELKTAMNITLKVLAKKISAGSKIGLQLEDRDKPKIENEMDIQAAEKELLDAYNDFQKIRHQLQNEISCIAPVEGAQELLHLMYKDDPDNAESTSS